MPSAPHDLRNIRRMLVIVIIALVLSGVTAFPLTWEVKILLQLFSTQPWAESIGLTPWLHRVHTGLAHNDAQFPFIAYGTDWLAFAHLMIALAFYGPLKDPIKNKWVVEWGIACCILVLPLALICGPIRGIPWGWTLIDCSFGIFGIIPLLIAWRAIRRLEHQPTPA